MVMVIKATVNKSDYDNMLRTYWLKEDIDADLEVDGVLYKKGEIAFRGTSTLSFPKKGFKLDMLVAPDTRIWCPPQTILPAKIGNNLLGKNVPEIHCVVGYAQLISYPFSILYGTHTTTATKPVLIFLFV